MWRAEPAKIWFIIKPNVSLEKRLRAAEEYLKAHDAKLAPIIERYKPWRLSPHSDHYGELVSSMVGQQLSVKAAASIWRRVLALFEGRMPTPEQLLAADSEKLRACGVSYAKISYMKDLAQHIIDGKLDMAHIASLPDEELTKQLTAVKGIGEWSAHMFMIFSLGRLDILPVGDLGVRRAAMLLYDLAELPDKPTLEKLARKNHWNPYESVAAWYLWQSLNNAPKETRHS